VERADSFVPFLARRKQTTHIFDPLRGWRGTNMGQCSPEERSWSRTKQPIYLPEKGRLNTNLPDFSPAIAISQLFAFSKDQVFWIHLLGVNPTGSELFVVLRKF
ncbi:hypothetical protein NPIL_237491, partial [Nephila pilipes]